MLDTPLWTMFSMLYPKHNVYPHPPWSCIPCFHQIMVTCPLTFNHSHTSPLYLNMAMYPQPNQTIATCLLSTQPWPPVYFLLNHAHVPTHQTSPHIHLPTHIHMSICAVKATWQLTQPWSHDHPSSNGYMSIHQSQPHIIHWSLLHVHPPTHGYMSFTSLSHMPPINHGHKFTHSTWPHGHLPTTAMCPVTQPWPCIHPCKHNHMLLYPTMAMSLLTNCANVSAHTPWPYVYLPTHPQPCVLRSSWLVPHLPWSLYSLPQAEVEQNNDQHQAGCELPPWRAQVINATTLMEVQHTTPEGERQQVILEEATASQDRNGTAELVLSSSSLSYGKYLVWSDKYKYSQITLPTVTELC